MLFNTIPEDLYPMTLSSLSLLKLITETDDEDLAAYLALDLNLSDCSDDDFIEAFYQGKDQDDNMWAGRSIHLLEIVLSASRELQQRVPGLNLPGAMLLVSSLPAMELVSAMPDNFLRSSEKASGWLGRLPGYSQAHTDAGSMHHRFVSMQFTRQLARLYKAYGVGGGVAPVESLSIKIPCCQKQEREQRYPVEIGIYHRYVAIGHPLYFSFTPGDVQGVGDRVRDPDLSLTWFLLLQSFSACPDFWMHTDADTQHAASALLQVSRDYLVGQITLTAALANTTQARKGLLEKTLYPNRN